MRILAALLFSVSLSVQAGLTQPWGTVRAMPTQCSGNPCATTIAFSTQGAPGEVKFRRDGGDWQRVAYGSHGQVTADWIQPESMYEFGLWVEGVEQDVVTVTGRDKSCAITVNVDGGHNADHITWTGCGTASSGLQSALDLADIVYVTGQGTIVIHDPLIVPDHTTINASHDIRFVGAPLHGKAYRQQGNNPLFRIRSSDVVLNGVYVDGTDPFFTATSALISVENATDVRLLNVNVRVARMGIAIKHSARVSIAGMDNRVYLTDHDKYSPGAQLWIFSSDDVLVRNSSMKNRPMYDIGPPAWDPRPDPEGMDTNVDMLAAYGATRMRVFDSTFRYGPTAGVYFACAEHGVPCQWEDRPRKAVLRNLTIEHFQQFNADLAAVRQLELSHSDIHDSKLGLVSISNESRWNYLHDLDIARGEHGWPKAKLGAITIMRGSQYNEITDSIIDGGMDYSALFRCSEVVDDYEFAPARDNIFANNTTSNSVFDCAQSNAIY